MSATDTQTLRWSSVRDCPRKAVYEATNAPHRERSEREERILWRGKSIGRDYAAFLANKYGAENVLTEVAVKWPLGVGHMDIYLVPTRTAIEVLSSAHASEQMIQSKLLQLVGYIEHAPALDIDAGALVVIDPSDLTEEVFPVAKTSRQYKTLVDEMRARVEAVQAWAEHGALPMRVCDKPADARSHFCQYAQHCFDDAPPWEPPTLEQIVAAPHVLEAVETLRNVKQERKVIGQRDKQLEQQQKDAQTLLDELPVGKVQVGRYEVSRSHVQRKPTFAWEKAETAGVFEPGLYGDFFKPGAAYDTWDVQAVADENYGETPF